MLKKQEIPQPSNRENINLEWANNLHRDTLFCGNLWARGYFVWSTYPCLRLIFEWGFRLPMGFFLFRGCNDQPFSALWRLPAANKPQTKTLSTSRCFSLAMNVYVLIATTTTRREEENCNIIRRVISRRFMPMELAANSRILAYRLKTRPAAEAADYQRSERAASNAIIFTYPPPPWPSSFLPVDRMRRSRGVLFICNTICTWNCVKRKQLPPLCSQTARFLSCTIFVCRYNVISRCLCFCTVH